MRAHESTGDSHAEMYPVWWSDDFELSTLDEVDRRMREGFSRPSSGAFQMDKWPGLKDGPVPARNCEELLGYVDADYTIETDHNFGHWQVMRCRTIMALKDALPASVSHLRDFVLDAEALDIFPMFFRESSLRFGRCRQHLYNQARFSIKADIGGRPTEGRNVFDTADPTFEIETHSDREIFITTRHRSARLTIVAGGDFNGDGLDDILLETNRWQFHRDSVSTGIEASTGWTENKHFILSRDCPDGVLWVVNADDFLYSKEDCEDWRAETEWSVRHW